MPSLILRVLIASVVHVKLVDLFGFVSYLQSGVMALPL